MSNFISSVYDTRMGVTFHVGDIFISPSKEYYTLRKIELNSLGSSHVGEFSYLLYDKLNTFLREGKDVSEIIEHVLASRIHRYIIGDSPFKFRHASHVMFQYFCSLYEVTIKDGLDNWV